MNSYKITYVAGEGDTEQTYITERTEAAARKFFKKVSGGREIVDVELYDTEASATKEQERETLEKIKAMVAELGPQSYLATAFEGTFEDAETNIENDFAFSMKARVESLEEQLREAGGKYNALKTDAAHLEAERDAAREELAVAQEQIAALKRQQLPEELRRDLVETLTAEAQVSRARMAEAADKMAMCAESAACVLFKDSVARYRAEKARAEAMEQRAAELAAMEPKDN